MKNMFIFIYLFFAEEATQKQFSKAKEKQAVCKERLIMCSNSADKKNNEPLNRAGQGHRESFSFSTDLSLGKELSCSTLKQDRF